MSPARDPRKRLPAAPISHNVRKRCRTEVDRALDGPTVAAIKHVLQPLYERKKITRDQFKAAIKPAAKALKKHYYQRVVGGSTISCEQMRMRARKILLKLFPDFWVES